MPSLSRDARELRSYRFWIRQLPLIALLGALCAVGAWLFVRDDPKVYEKTLSFAIRPSDRVPIDSADNVVSTLASRDSTIAETLLGVLASVPPQPKGAESMLVRRSITLRPGSLIFDVRFRSLDRAAIGAPASIFRSTAPRRVAASYSIYELEQLADSGAPQLVPGKALQILALAVLLGCALGVAVVLLRHAAGRTRGESDEGSAAGGSDPNDDVSPRKVKTGTGRFAPTGTTVPRWSGPSSAPIKPAYPPAGQNPLSESQDVAEA